MNFKLLSTLIHGKPVQAVDTWTVRWESRYDDYSHAVSPEVEVFTSKEEAERFATSLREAFKLIRHTNRTNVRVRANQ